MAVVLDVGGWPFGPEGLRPDGSLEAGRASWRAAVAPLQVYARRRGSGRVAALGSRSLLTGLELAKQGVTPLAICKVIKGKGLREK